MKSINRLCEDEGRSNLGSLNVGSIQRSPRCAREDSSVGFVKRVVVLCLLLIASPSIHAQPEFFGYFESEASTMTIGSESYTYGFNKLRLDVEARPNDHVLIGANVNFQKYWGKTTWNVYDFIPSYQDQGLTMNIELQDTILLDNMYMRVSMPFADITVGRQQISPGVGYAWNPTDIFNTKSLMDPSYEQTGVPAIRMEVPISDRFALDVVVDPEEDWENTTKQVWLSGGMGRFDVSLTVADFIWYKVPISTGIYDFGVASNRMLTGTSIVGEIFGVGIWTEYAANSIDDELYGFCPVCDYPALLINDRKFEEWIVGLDYTFENSLYVLGEFLHNGNGISDKSSITLNDYFMAFEGTTHSLMQDYTFLYAMHPTFDYTTLSAIVFANLNDNSGVFNPMLEWNAFEDTYVRLQGSIAWGEDDTEFGLQDLGLAVRVTSNF